MATSPSERSNGASSRFQLVNFETGTVVNLNSRPKSRRTWSKALTPEDAAERNQKLEAIGDKHRWIIPGSAFPPSAFSGEAKKALSDLSLWGLSSVRTLEMASLARSYDKELTNNDLKPGETADSLSSFLEKVAVRVQEFNRLPRSSEFLKAKRQQTSAFAKAKMRKKIPARWIDAGLIEHEMVTSLPGHIHNYVAILRNFSRQKAEPQSRTVVTRIVYLLFLALRSLSSKCPQDRACRIIEELTRSRHSAQTLPDSTIAAAVDAIEERITNFSKHHGPEVEHAKDLIGQVGPRAILVLFSRVDYPSGFLPSQVHKRGRFRRRSSR
jgi:hypothetical protein